MEEYIGAYLKRQRDVRRISLETISVATKINVRTLRAIEDEDLEHLPSPVFVKGFVRSYAREIGLDSEEVGLQFEQHLRQWRGGGMLETQPSFWSKAKGNVVNSWFYFVVLAGIISMTILISSH